MNVDEMRLCTELWDKHKERIHQFCSIKLRSCPSEVDDVVSEVFLALCKKVSESGPPEKPKEWLYGTFGNLLNKTYRNIYSLRENETAFSDNDFELPHMKDDIKSKEDEMYIAELFKKFGDRLSVNERELMELVIYKQLKHKEIALMQNSTETAIKQKYYRVISKLRKIREKLEK